MKLMSAAALAGAARCDRVRLGFELVLQWLQFLRLAARRVRKRLCEEPVCEPGIAWQQRAVEIRSDDPAGAAAFETRLPVVAEARNDAAERLCARVENRPAGMVLEPRQGPRAAGAE